MIQVDGEFLTQEEINAIHLKKFATSRQNQVKDIFIFCYCTGQSITFQSERNERSLRENELKINVLGQKKLISKKQNEQTIFIIALLVVILLLVFLFWNYE